MIALNVRGRMLKRPVGKVEVLGTTLRFRIDDERQPEFWLEAEVSFPELVKLIAGILHEGEWKDDKECCEAVDQLTRVLVFFAPPAELTEKGK